MICWRLDRILALKIPCNIMIAVECEVYKKISMKSGLLAWPVPFLIKPSPTKKDKKIEFFCVQHNYYGILYNYVEW